MRADGVLTLRAVAICRVWEGFLLHNYPVLFGESGSFALVPCVGRERPAGMVGGVAMVV